MFQVLNGVTGEGDIFYSVSVTLELSRERTSLQVFRNGFNYKNSLLLQLSTLESTNKFFSKRKPILTFMFSSFEPETGDTGVLNHPFCRCVCYWCHRVPHPPQKSPSTSLTVPTVDSSTQNFLLVLQTGPTLHRSLVNFYPKTS